VPGAGCVRKISLEKANFFQFFILSGQKYVSSDRVKKTWIRAGSALDLLWVRSMHLSGRVTAHLYSFDYFLLHEPSCSFRSTLLIIPSGRPWFDSRLGSIPARVALRGRITRKKCVFHEHPLKMQEIVCKCLVANLGSIPDTSFL